MLLCYRLEFGSWPSGDYREAVRAYVPPGLYIRRPYASHMDMNQSYILAYASFGTDSHEDHASREMSWVMDACLGQKGGNHLGL